jgi:hypothetical protein
VTVTKEKRLCRLVRLFREEFVGMIGGMLSSQGKDKREIVKKFTGELES